MSAANPFAVFDVESFAAGMERGESWACLRAARSLKVLSPTSKHSISGFVEQARKSHWRYLRALRAQIIRCEDCMTRPVIRGETLCATCRDNRAERHLAAEAACRGKTGTSSGPEARPVTATAHEISWFAP